MLGLPPQGEPDKRFTPLAFASIYEVELVAANQQLQIISPSGGSGSGNRSK